MDTEIFDIIIPAKNEERSIGLLIEEILKLYKDVNIIIINDGSTDDTEKICRSYAVNLINNPYSRGNGAAIKKGTRKATQDIMVMMDADGQHQAKDIAKLLAKIEDGHDLVIASRKPSTHASLSRRLGNFLLNKLASFMTGYKIEDLTSGFRAVKRKKFKKFLYLLPNGFSYPTTTTMAFFRSGYSICYVPIEAKKRDGKSHINLVKDGIKFFTIILKIGALFSPMRLFLPISTLLFLTGLLYYSYTFIIMGRFTNMSALLFISSLIIFMMGILSEQISSLHYKTLDSNDNEK